MGVMGDKQRRSNINIIKDSKGSRGENNRIKLVFKLQPKKTSWK